MQQFQPASRPVRQIIKIAAIAFVGCALLCFCFILIGGYSGALLYLGGISLLLIGFVLVCLI